MKFPLPPQEPLTDSSGLVTNAWYRAFTGLTPAVIYVIAGDTVGMPQTDAIALVSQTPGRTAFSTTLLLNPTPTPLQTLLVVDTSGGAGQVPIDLQPPGNVLINGQPVLVLDNDYGFRQIMFNGSGWSVIGRG